MQENVSFALYPCLEDFRVNQSPVQHEKEDFVSKNTVIKAKL